MKIQIERLKTEIFSYFVKKESLCLVTAKLFFC
jgi:hypothetical protein